MNSRFSDAELKRRWAAYNGGPDVGKPPAPLTPAFIEQSRNGFNRAPVRQWC